VLFTGTYQRTLDGKGRVLLPKKMRASLGENEILFLTPGTDHCLELHTSQSLDRLASEASQSGNNSTTVRSFSRLFYAQAEQLDLDPQGRIRIPARLAQWSGLEKEIALVGVGYNWEIWDNATWQEYFANHARNFDWVHQSTFDSQNPNTEPKAPYEGKPAPKTPK
jgi:MraZ protein